MKKYFNYSNYGNDLSLIRRDAEHCSQSGDCEPFVREVMVKPYVKKQLTQINPDSLRRELHEYGAWDEEELQNHEMNLLRWLWISAGNITDELICK